MSSPTRTYTKGLITVEWRPELCVHCQSCVIGLPNVFDMNKRPWVNMDGATEAEIVAQVEQCPSKALAIGSNN